MPRAFFSRLQRGRWLGIVLILLLPLPAWSQSSDEGRRDTLDPALRSIVRLVLEQPNDDEVVVRAGQWSRAKNRSTELFEAILQQARLQKSDDLYHFCARFLLQAEDPLRAISVLEEGCSIPDATRCPHALGRIWLQGGWVEAAQSIHRAQGVDAWTDILLQMVSGKDISGETLPGMDSSDRDYLIQTLSRLNLCQQGARLLESVEDPQASLSILIRGGDLAAIDELLTRFPGLVQKISPGEILPLARLRGQLPGDLFIPRPVAAEWKASMGLEEARLNPSGQSARVSRLLQSLNIACRNGDTPLARRIWISIEMLLPPLQAYPALNPRWQKILGPALAPWTDPQGVADQMGNVTEPGAATLCRRAMLYSQPGSETEARLWFHAGRLSSTPAEMERARLIFPKSLFRWPTPISGISVTTRLREAEIPIPLPNPIALRVPADSMLGEVDGLPLRGPEEDFSMEEWVLADWKLEPNRDGSLPTPPFPWPGQAGKGDLLLTFATASGQTLEVTGDSQRWSIRLGGEERQVLQSSAGESLFDAEGLPRLDLLQTLITPCPSSLSTRIDEQKWPASVRDFADGCGQFLRNPDWARYARLQKSPAELKVSVGPLTGTFVPILSSARLSIHESPHQIPQPLRTLSAKPPEVSPAAAAPLGQVATLIQERKLKSPAASNAVSSTILIPSGDDLLSVTGTGDRLAVTRSGHVGWLPNDSVAPTDWWPLLRTPLPGSRGLPPLPKDVYPPRDPWADAVTPRVRETRCADGSVFLVIGQPLLRIDEQGPQLLSWPAPLSEKCTSAQLLDIEGKVPSSISDPLVPWFIDSDGQFLYGPDFRQPLPAEGAYSLHGHPQGPLVLGQHRGETWLALWKEGDWIFLDLPPLPGERDRPFLRAAAIEVIGDQILLVADRLWRLHPDQVPQALIPSPKPGAYRAVHWVQPSPQVRDHRVIIQRPWGVEQVWGFSDD